MRRATSGFTVIELMAVVLITAVLLTLAVPAFLDLLARRRLEGAANELSTDLHYARSEAVSRQLDVALTTLPGGTGYTITVASTPAPTEIKRVTLPAEMKLTGGVNLTYTGLRGIPKETGDDDESITLSSSRTSARLQVDNNFMGRVRLCSPDDSFRGYAAC